MNKIFLQLLLLISFSSIFPSFANEGNQAKPGKPNVIIIMADDMGYGDPKCYNPESKIPTPNMDKLSEQGILFTDAHSA